MTALSATEKQGPQTVAFSRDATNVFFHILTRCNLRCRHCYINPRQHGTETLGIDTIRAWLALFASRSTEANVIFLGGEPTLHPHLAAAVRHARRLGYQSITIDTNGYLFHDILAKIDPEDVDFISFSLDGARRETNDRQRGAGSFDICLAGIAAASRRGFATSLIYTVSAANLHELEKMVPLVAHMGIQRFFIQVIGIRGRSAGTDASPDREQIVQVPRKLWQQVVPAVAAEIAAQGISVIYPKVYLSPQERFECAGRVADNYFIFPNGRVYRCPLCEDYPLHAYTIVDNQLVPTPKINESDLFELSIAEGCVMNRLVQPGNLHYTAAGVPEYQVACCLLKEQISPAHQRF